MAFVKCAANRDVLDSLRYTAFAMRIRPGVPDKSDPVLACVHPKAATSCHHSIPGSESPRVLKEYLKLTLRHGQDVAAYRCAAQPIYIIPETVWRSNIVGYASGFTIVVNH